MSVIMQINLVDILVKAFINSSIVRWKGKYTVKPVITETQKDKDLFTIASFWITQV